MEKERIKQTKKESRVKERELAETFNQLSNDELEIDEQSVEKIETLSTIYGHYYEDAEKKGN